MVTKNTYQRKSGEEKGIVHCRLSTELTDEVGTTSRSRPGRSETAHMVLRYLDGEKKGGTTSKKSQCIKRLRSEDKAELKGRGKKKKMSIGEMLWESKESQAKTNRSAAIERTNEGRKAMSNEGASRYSTKKADD